MIDPASVIVAAAVLALGWLIGRHGRLKARPKPIQPICLCDHHYGTHDPESGACRHEEVAELYSTANGTYQQSLACPCVRYTGPQPVEQYWVPPSADMSIVTAPRAIEHRTSEGDRERTNP